MELISRSAQIRTETLGNNCGPSLLGTKGLLSELSDSLSSSSKVELDLASESSNSNNLVKQVYKDLTDETSSAINNFFGSEITDVSSLTKAVESTLVSIVDPGSIVNAVSSTSTALLGSVGGSVGLFDPAAKSALVRNAREASKGDCSGGLGTGEIFSATLTGVSAIGGNVVDRAKEIGSALSTFSSIKGNTSGFGDGLMNIIGKSLRLAFKNELFTLKKIIKVINSLNDELEKFDSDEYQLDHSALLKEVRRLLTNAGVNLDTVNAILQQGGGLAEGNYALAEADVTTAADLLKNPEIDLISIPTTRYLKVVGLFIELELLIKTFDKISHDNRSRVGYFGEFKTSFSVPTPGIDFLFAPIVTAIRCRLVKTVSDIDNTLNKNQLLLFLLKEKQWYAELLITLALFKASKTFKQTKEALADLNFKVDTDPGRVVTSYSGLASKEIILALLDRYKQLVRKKMSLDIPASSVTGMGNLCIVRITQYITERPNFQGALFTEVFFDGVPPNLEKLATSLADNPLDKLIGQLDTEAIEGIVLAQQYMEVLTEKGLDASFDALMQGDLESFFSFDTAASNLSKQLEQYASIAVECSRNTGDVRSVNYAKQAFNRSQIELRAAKIYESVYYHSDQKYIETVLTAKFTE